MRLQTRANATAAGGGGGARASLASRRISAAAREHRRNVDDTMVGERSNANFWDDALSELAVGKLSIYDFDPAAVLHINASANDGGGAKGSGRLGAAFAFTEEMVQSPTTPQVLSGAVVAQPPGLPKQARIDGEM